RPGCRRAGSSIMTNTCEGCGDDLIGMYDLVDALEAVIRSSDPAKREALAATIDEYNVDDGLEWAFSAQSPTLLHQLMMAIDGACRSESQSKARPAIHLVNRKPEGSA